MADLQAQRTLVKSPPELWAELSDPESLARRLSDFGEIRITRLVPEQTVAWEGERASGTVELESSGWGTRVRLTASARAGGATTPGLAAIDRITAVVEDDDRPPEAKPGVRPPGGATVVAPNPSPSPSPSPSPAPAPARSDPGPAERSAARVARRAAAAAQAEGRAASPPPPPPSPPPQAPPAAVVAPDPAPPRRRGFFARLLGRRRRSRDARLEPAPAGDPPARSPSLPPPPAAPAPATARTTRAEALAAAAEEPGPPTVESPRVEEPDEGARYAPPMPGPSARRRPAAHADAAGPPAAPSRIDSGLDPEQTMAVLSSVLDDLGAAHHRPFSRQ